MRDYIIRRIFLLIPNLLLVTLVVFLVVRFIPGSALDIMVSEMSAVSGEELDVEAIKAKLGLDAPIQLQYARWLGAWPQEDGEFAGIFQGNLGESLWNDEPVLDMILNRLPVTFELAVLSLIIAFSLGIPVAVLSAIRQDSPFDYTMRSITIFFVAAPGFWLATMVVVYPSILFDWAPSIEYIPFAEDPLGNLGQFLIPAFLMGAAMSGASARYGRTLMLEVLRQDYIRTAWSKGLRERVVLVRHALKNTLIPLVTLMGMEIATLVAGSVIMEQIFVLPGVGRLFYHALVQRDYPVISGVNFMIAGIILFVNIVVDISYAYLDPRVSYK